MGSTPPIAQLVILFLYHSDSGHYWVKRLGGIPLIIGGKKPKIAPLLARTEPITQASLTKEIQEIESVSSNNTELKEDIAELKEELQELEERKQAGEVHIAFLAMSAQANPPLLKRLFHKQAWKLFKRRFNA